MTNLSPKPQYHTVEVGKKIKINLTSNGMSDEREFSRFSMRVRPDDFIFAHFSPFCYTLTLGQEDEVDMFETFKEQNIEDNANLVVHLNGNFRELQLLISKVRETFHNKRDLPLPLDNAYAEWEEDNSIAEQALKEAVANFANHDVV